MTQTDVTTSATRLPSHSRAVRPVALVNDDSLWLADLNPLRFVKMDFTGNRVYTWLVPRELPDGFLEVHSFSVDSDLNLYCGDNQYGRTQKLVPRTGADPALIIRPAWRQK